MMQDYCEIFCQAVDTIVNQAVEKLNFDKTIPCTIVDASKASQGIYRVDDGSLEFEAISTVTSYQEKDGVYVTIPQNDFDQDKIITGKIALEDQEKLSYSGPLSGMIKATEQIFDTTNQTTGIIANGTNDSIPTYDPDVVMTGINGKLIAEKEFSSGAVMSGFTRLGIQIDFKTFLSSATDGEYGLLAVVQTSEDYEGKHYVKIGNYFFTSKEMFGDYYNFNMFYPQEVVFDISPLCDIIEKVSVYLVQNNQFLTYSGNGEKVPLSTDVNGHNIYSKNCNAYLGYSIEDLKGDNLIQLYTSGSLKYSQEDTEEGRFRNVSLRWIRKISDEEEITYKLIENLEEDLNSKDVEICWYEKSQGFGISDSWGGTEWKRIVTYKNPEGKEETSPLTWDRETLLYQTDNYILKKLTKNHYAILNGVFKKDDEKSLTIYPDGKEIKENDISLQFDTENPKGILKQFTSGAWVNYEDELASDISFYNYLSFPITLDKDLAKEQIKCIILIGEETLTPSNEIMTFENISPVVDKTAVHNVLSELSISCADGTGGNYYIYGPDYQAVDKSQSKLNRLLKPYLNNSLIVGEDYNIIWTVPLSNTMLAVNEPLSIQSYLKVETFKQWFEDIYNLVKINEWKYDITYDGGSATIRCPMGSKAAYHLKNSLKAEDVNGLSSLYQKITSLTYLSWTVPGDYTGKFDNYIDNIKDHVPSVNKEECLTGKCFNIKTSEEYKKLSDGDKKYIDEQIDLMIKTMYNFFNVNNIKKMQIQSYSTSTDTYENVSNGEIVDFILYNNDFVEVSTLNLNYKINSRYSPKQDFNNIVECCVTRKDNTKISMRTKLEMSFGQQGSTGYNLVLDFIGDSYGIPLFLGEEQKIKAQLYDGNGTMIDLNSEVSINWSWMYSQEFNIIKNKNLALYFDSENTHGDECTISVVNGSSSTQTIAEEDEEISYLNSDGNYNILQASLVYGGYTLTAFLPIPIIVYQTITEEGETDNYLDNLYNLAISEKDDKSNTEKDNYKKFLQLKNTINDLYLIGADHVIYSIEGKPYNFSQFSYGFNSGIFEEEKEEILDTLNIKEKCSLYGRFNTTSKDYKIQLTNKAKDSDYLALDSKYQLIPSSIYDSQRLYGVYYVSAGSLIINDDELSSKTFLVEWYQPILLTQNKESSTLINKWDGLSVSIGDNNILTPTLIVGNKNIKNEFSGLALGTYSQFDETNTTSSKDNTGLYGFKNGSLVYSFSDDGTGFIGGESGRLTFDGNKCQLYGGAFGESMFTSNYGIVIDLNRELDGDNNFNSSAVKSLGFITIGKQSDSYLKLGANSIKDKIEYPLLLENNSGKIFTSLSYDGILDIPQINVGEKINVKDGGITFERSGKKYTIKESSKGVLGIYLM